MPTLKPFRALRYQNHRVPLARVLAQGAEADPRHVRRLLDVETEEGDGRDAPARRARFRLAQWQQAGVMKRDDNAALYVVRRRDDDDSSALGVFGVLSLDAAPPEVPADLTVQARLSTVGVAVEPTVVAFSDSTGRVRRALENATESEADATWTVGRTTFELWVLDDESAAARVAALVAANPLRVAAHADVLVAQAAWWMARSEAALADADASREEEAPQAGAFALAFVHPDDDIWAEVPVGVALAPLGGAL